MQPCVCLRSVFCFPCNCCASVSRKCSFQSRRINDDETPVALEMETKRTPLLSAIDAVSENTTEATIDDTGARLQMLETTTKGSTK